MTALLAMNRMLSLGLVLSVATSLCAQHQFLPMGQPAEQVNIGGGLYRIHLPFLFTMPGGVQVTELHIGKYGRVFEPGESFDSSPSTYEMTDRPEASINVFWGTGSYPAGSGVFTNTTLANVATITWAEVTGSFSATAPFTYQCQLHADGRIVMVYDNRCSTAQERLIGLCPGTGVTLPPAVDLSSALSTSFGTPSPTVYEFFETSPFDLVGTALEFAPVGAGGLNGWTIHANGGIADIEIRIASQRSFGGGCYCRKTYTYVPNALGGYDVATGPSAFDGNIGALVGAIADDAITATSIDLGFPMLFPDGSLHQLVDVDPNGRILPAGAAGLFGDLAPSIADITGDGYPYFFGLWTDWNVLQATSDGIYFQQSAGVATFTWNNVAQFGSIEVPPCTWQIRLHASGVVEVTHEDLGGLNQIGSSADDIAVGLTTGAPNSVGETDHSALTNVATSVAGPTYEWWDASGALPAEPCDLRLADTPLLVATNQPIEATNWQLQALQVGNAQFGLYLLSFATTDQWLEPLGSPCRQSVPADWIELRFANGAGAIDPLHVPIPSVPQTLNVVLHAQCVVDGATSPQFTGFAGSPFALSFSNALAGRIGSF
jgi:hypothetical protein